MIGGFNVDDVVSYLIEVFLLFKNFSISTDIFLKFSPNLVLKLQSINKTPSPASTPPNKPIILP